MKNFKGFTLIELLVVISIIGVLSSIVFVSFSGSRDKARLAKAQNFDAQVSHALGAYAVGIWRFEEGSGIDIHDESGFGNDGTMGNGACTPGTGSCPSWAIGQGVYNNTNALSFDGNDYVNVSPNNELRNLGTSNDFSIVAWTYLTSSTGIEAIFSYGYGNHSYGRFMLGAKDSHGFVSLYDNSTYLQKEGNINVYNKWSHIAGIFSRTDNKIYLYVDGRNEGSVDWGGIIESERNHTRRIGTLHRSGGQTFYFNGSIDNVCIYNHALSSAQIQQHYVQGAPAHGIAVNDK